MTYVIGRARVDVVDWACVEECPVDCIYEGARALNIHLDECVNYEDDLPAYQHQHLADNAALFFETLPGHDGAAKVGPLEVDTPLVAGVPAQQRR
jgi:hypothetical protein